MAKPKKTRKAKTNPSIAKRGVGAAKQGAKKAANASAVIKKKTAKNTKSVLGIGAAPKRTRAATQGDLLRKGKSLLRGGSAALARFIAARYSPKAIAKYQDYAGRLRRSKRLIKQIVKIDDATYRIKGYIIKTDTAGNNPYSCTCPDFSQFSIDARNWLGSKAGPFNPCKHMMAVRDRPKSGPPPRPPFIGGQCAGVVYSVGMVVKFYSLGNFVGERAGSNSNCVGPIRSIGFDSSSPGNTLAGVFAANGFRQTLVGNMESYGASWNASFASIVGSPNNCGNPPNEPGLPDVNGCTDPSANNLNVLANIDDGSCTYTILGCTDPAAFNYDPLANTDDGSCVPVVLGCTDPAAFNYDPAANTNDGSCVPVILGCTDPSATNYNASANTDDDSCTY